MNGKISKNLINQLKKYQLTTLFSTPEELELWLEKIPSNHAINIINLNIDPEEIKFPRNLLINENLLNCADYQKRIIAMSKLKNEDDCWHLFEHLCSSVFLNSKYYYQDMAIISTAPSLKNILQIIDNDVFQKSKYHKEDLIMIIKSLNLELNDNILVTESLIEVACNQDSINSLYHRQDMDLIFKSSRNCLQLFDTYHMFGLNSLAINPVSLKDPYHLENMHILSKFPLTSDILYKIMTDPQAIQSKYYRDEINVITNAKSNVTAITMYYYMTNPQDNSYLDILSIIFFDLDYNDESHQALGYCYQFLNRKNNHIGHKNPEYLKYLNLLNDIDDKIVPYFESLLSNNNLYNSPYFETDLNIFLEVNNHRLCHDLYHLMTNQDSLNSQHHLTDIQLIIAAENEKKRRLLFDKATNKVSLTSCYHTYDMLYIANLNLSKIKSDIYNQMYYYLFNPLGIDSTEHIIALEKLAKGELYQPDDTVNECLNDLESELLSNSTNTTKFSLTSVIKKEKILTRIKKFFNSKR